jgi:hypothetical protein
VTHPNGQSYFSITSDINTLRTVYRFLAPGGIIPKNVDITNVFPNVDANTQSMLQSHNQGNAVQAHPWVGQGETKLIPNTKTPEGKITNPTTPSNQVAPAANDVKPARANPVCLNLVEPDPTNKAANRIKDSVKAELENIAKKLYAFPEAKSLQLSKDGIGNAQIGEKCLYVLKKCLDPFGMGSTKNSSTLSTLKLTYSAARCKQYLFSNHPYFAKYKRTMTNNLFGNPLTQKISPDQVSINAATKQFFMDFLVDLAAHLKTLGDQQNPVATTSPSPMAPTQSTDSTIISDVSLLNLMYKYSFDRMLPCMNDNKIDFNKKLEKVLTSMKEVFEPEILPMYDEDTYRKALSVIKMEMRATRMAQKLQTPPSVPPEGQKEANLNPGPIKQQLIDNTKATLGAIISTLETNELLKSKPELYSAKYREAENLLNILNTYISGAPSGVISEGLTEYRQKLDALKVKDTNPDTGLSPQARRRLSYLKLSKYI